MGFRVESDLRVHVTIEQSHNRGCTIARWLRRLLLQQGGGAGLSSGRARLDAEFGCRFFAFSPWALVGLTEERATSKVPQAHSVEAWLMKEADVRYGVMIAALCEPWPKRGPPLYTLPSGQAGRSL